MHENSRAQDFLHFLIAVVECAFGHAHGANRALVVRGRLASDGGTALRGWWFAWCD